MTLARLPLRECRITLEVSVELLPRYRAPRPELGSVAAEAGARRLGRTRELHRRPRRTRLHRPGRAPRRSRLRAGIAHFRGRERERGARVPFRGSVVEHDPASRWRRTLVDLDRFARPRGTPESPLAANGYSLDLDRSRTARAGARASPRLRRRCDRFA